MKKSVAMIYSLGSMLCWSISPILIRYVKDYFSVSFQNFFRFAVSILVMWSFTLITIGRRDTAAAIRGIQNPIPKLACIALCNFAHQLFLIKGVYLLLPGLVTIVEESTIIFAVALAFIFIPDERRLITNPCFIAGLVLAVAGVILTALPEITSSTESASSDPVLGVLFVLVSSLAWALFSLMIRLWLPSTPAPISSSLIFSLVVPFFLISNLIGAAGGSPGILQAGVPVSAWLLLSISGVIGIGLGYSFYYQAIKGLGVTLASSMGLIIPLISMMVSYFVFGETLSAVQAAGTAALLAGCFLIIRQEN